MPELPPIPPLETVVDWQAYAAGGACVLVGLILVLWGRRVHRVALLLALGGVGYGLGGTIAEAFGTMPEVTSVCAAAVLAFFGLLAARLLWAALLAALSSAAAVAVLLFRVLPKPPMEVYPKFGPADTLEQWLYQAGDYLWKIFQVQWNAQGPTLGLAIGVAALLPLLVLLLRPRLGAILMTSLLGAAAIVGGGVAAAGRARNEIYVSAFENWYIPTGFAGLLFLFGGVRQYHKALAKKKPAEEEEPDEGDEEKGKAKSSSRSKKD